MTGWFTVRAWMRTRGSNGSARFIEMSRYFLERYGITSGHQARFEAQINRQDGGSEAQNLC